MIKKEEVGTTVELT